MRILAALCIAAPLASAAQVPVTASPTITVDIAKLRQQNPELARQLEATLLGNPPPAVAPPTQPPSLGVNDPALWGGAAALDSAEALGQFVKGLDGQPGALKGYFHTPAAQKVLGMNLKLIAKLNQGIADAVGLRPAPYDENDPMLDPRLYACLTTPSDPACASRMKYVRENLLAPAHPGGAMSRSPKKNP